MPAKYSNIKVREMYQKSLRDNKRLLKDAERNDLNTTVVQRAIAHDTKVLANTTPPVVEGAERDKLIKRQLRLEEAMILGSEKLGIPPMPTENEMKKRPHGAVAKHIRWEKRWKNNTLNEAGEVVPAENGYGAIFQWKDTKRAVGGAEQEAEDIDLASIESFRPRESTASGSRFIDYPRMSMGGYDNLPPTVHGMTVAPDAYPGYKLVSGKVEVAEPTVWDTCQASTKSGTKCARKNVSPEKPWCSEPHRKQFED